MQKITRHKAGLIHFCLSLSIFSIVFLVLITLWYPEPYFNASGGWQGLRIVASIDVVLGPLLTLIIFNPEKSRRELGIDLSIILSLQVAALIWGIHTVYQQRPVAVVFWDNGFLTVAAIDLTNRNYPLEKLQQFSLAKPALIYAEKPGELENLKKVLVNIREHQIAPHHQTELYRPLDQNFAGISRFQLDIDKEIKTNPALAPQIDKLLQAGKYDKSELKYFTLQAKYHDMILVFTSFGEQVGYLTPD